jgi:SAM-dependent methyltransferase
MTETMTTTTDHLLWDLENLAGAHRLCDWMFAQYTAYVPRARAAEIGAGIGTFSGRMLEAGAREVLLVEPDEVCARELRNRFGEDERVEVSEDALPDAPSLEARTGELDLVVSQNVLEHIDDHAAAVAAMAQALRPGGRMVLLVPAHPRLFGKLDERFDHHRRYTRAMLGGIVEEAGLEVERLYHFNLLGIPGWWVQNRRAEPSVSRRSLAAYEALVRLWRPLEERLSLPWGLSLIVHARRPAAA